MSTLEAIRRQLLRASRSARHRAPALGAPVAVGPGADPTILLSFRVANGARLQMLQAMTTDLGRALGHSSLSVHADDASDEQWRVAAANALATTRLGVRHDVTAEPFPASVDRLLATAGSDVFYLQFDDTITADLDTSWLGAAATLLRSYRGRVHVVAPPWAMAVDADHRTGVVRVTPFERRGDSYRFWLGGWRTPVHVEEVDGHQFGIFERFTYGFHCSNLVGDTDDFRRRLAWYREHVSATSIHQIELAAYTWAGPAWDHIALPLDGQCLVDLDWEHTAGAVRRDAPEHRRTYEVLAAGGRIEVRRD